MDGFLWLIFSWVVVALISYFLIGTFLGSGGSGQVTTKARKSIFGERDPEWFNEVILWLWASKRFSPSFIRLVVKALNDAAKKLTKLNQCEIHFAAISNGSQALDDRNVPVFEKVKAQRGSASGDHLVLNTKVSAARFELKVIASKQLADGNLVVVSNSNALITDIFGEVETRLAHIADELFVMSCFIGRPEMSIEMRENPSNPQSSNADQPPAIDAHTLEDLVRKCVVSAVLNFSLSEFLYSTSESARNSMARLSAEFRNLGFLNEHYPPPPPQQQQNNYGADQNSPPNVLQLRVVKAMDLGSKQGDILEPYVFIEMDEPSQKFVTTKAVSRMKDGSRYWEENFEFVLNPASSELLFEVYDEQSVPRHSASAINKDSRHPRDVFRSDDPSSPKRRFLGLSIVALNELKARSNLPAHHLRLQGKPYGNEEQGNVSGVLAVECRFLHVPTNSLSREPNSLVTPTMRHQHQHQQKFPVDFGGEKQRGTLSNFQPNYLYNAADNPESTSPSPPPPPMVLGSQQLKQPLGSIPFGNKQLDYHANNEGHNATSQNASEWERSQSSNLNFDYNTTMNAYDRQGSRTSTPSQQSLLIHQLNQQRPSPIEQELTGGQYQINRDQQQYSLERAAGRPRMVNERNPSKSFDQFSVPSILTHNPQGTQQPIQVQTTGESSPPPPVPPHQSPSALEETARQARGREPKRKLSKRRERSFFEELRARLSRGSSKRAKSLDEQNPELEEAVSVPPSRDQSQSRQQQYGPKYSAQFQEARSMAESSNSVRTWKNGTSLSGTSQLILELEGNGDGKKYYLIPPAVASEPAAVRLMHSGKKLHVHNNHMFVAVKPRGRVMCNVCGRSIAGNFTKQAYQCRDCRKVSHKSCHQRSSSPCHNSNLANLSIVEDVDWVDFLRQYQLEEYISMNGV